MNLAIRSQSRSPETLRAGLDAVLRRKGIVLDALSIERRAVLESGKPEAGALLTKLQTVDSRLSSLTNEGPGKMQVDEYRKRLKALEDEKESAEEALSTLSAGYARRIRSLSADYRTVSERLPSGSVLVEYICVPMYSFSSFKRGLGRYFAYVLHSSRDSSSKCAEPPELIDLGDASVIDEAVKEFREEIAIARTLWESGIFNEAEAERSLDARGRRLYDLALLPLEKHLSGRTGLFIAADGDLSLLPFGALKDGTGRYLAERCCIDYLCCGRDLLYLDDKALNSGETVIVSNPDFNMSSGDRAMALKSLPGRNTVTAFRGSESSSSLPAVMWSPLPGTEDEAGMIEKALRGEKVTKYQGRAALEEMLKSLRSPRRLHIATHGFFFEKKDDLSFSGESIVFYDDPARYSDNPLLRSGLALAGANRAGRETLQEGSDDGVLTSLEVSAMRLAGTDLVVLSACDTGLGKVSRGEGVFGLRRAFHLAGARTLVMSLWSVPDVETQQIMSGFYERLKKGGGKARALNEAGLAVMRERREKYGAAHPFFWAPFICVGEP